MLAITWLCLFSSFASASAPQSSHQTYTQDSEDIPEQLIRQSFTSNIDGKQHQFFVYLPKGYQQESQKQWPVLLTLHGNGERGNGLDELDYVKHHGPLYEAWVQRKDLPFIIIAPQLPMFDQDKRGISYLENRDASKIPKRLESGIPPHKKSAQSSHPITRKQALENLTGLPAVREAGWDVIEQDLLNILDIVKQNYQTNQRKVYLTGLSYGGFGTWYMASKHPEKFAAIAPVVGWGHPELMAPIAKHNIPVWQFAGGLDKTITIEHFYAGINELKKLGHNKLRFTVHENMSHDAWKRVYASDDFYQWLLTNQLSELPQ